MAAAAPLLYRDTGNVLPRLYHTGFYQLGINSEGNLISHNEESYRTTRAAFTSIEKIKHFFGYGGFGYFTLQNKIEHLAMQDRLNSPRIPRLSQQPTMKEYFGYIVDLSMENAEILNTRDVMITSVHNGLWNESSCLSKLIIGIQLFIFTFFREMKKQLADYRLCCCLRNSFNPGYNMTVIRENVTSELLNGTTSVTNYILRHRQVSAAKAEFTIADVTGLWGGFHNRVTFTVRPYISRSIQEAIEFPAWFNTSPPSIFKSKVLQVVSELRTPAV